ncbi:undecaprenyl-diphosphate phosphatase [Thermotoga sp.]|uniref:undecaprenyl-diphosphate phosphatase n=1 Tax=Thermotoga sp. TaxID=28240 RepID=UPI0025E7BB5A|nr:undecaprenyl-diphosphate phosphatase [Thermotoga sp.]MCD6551815.1 undecaprenyl-diphosphate phosphatase [Thermotoga sp.]
MEMLLGIVQGLTEFLPVSSSGHLVLFSHLLKLDLNAYQTAILHLGTLAAVVVFALDGIRRSLKSWRIVLNLVISTIPAGVSGILLENRVDETFSSPGILPFFFLFTAVILLFTRSVSGEKRMEEMTILDATLVGLAQVLALFPGISRSGTTIATLLFLKYRKEDALQYSFLMSIPVVLGAGILGMEKGTASLTAPLFAFFSGLSALYVLSKAVKSGKMWQFAYYCLFVAIVSYLVG